MQAAKRLPTTEKAPKKEILRIAPQAGPQTDFLSSTADIVIYGGAAGGGKTFGLLLEPLRHWGHPGFGGIIFRRETPQIRNEGGLWDESLKLFGPLGAAPVESLLEWAAPSGWHLKFTHLEHDKTVLNWQGAQIPFVGFDELTHFSEYQFFYMLSRNRSTTGIPGYVRATCNADADSWVRKLIDWWIGPDGFPIKERSGIVRWFIRIDEKLIWGDTRQELIDKYGKDELPKSLTFIPSRITDNKILMRKDPSYMANLRALSRVERMRLLDGNWNVRPSAGNYFQRGWFPVVDAMPTNVIGQIRYWDRAATKPNETNKDPDWTRGVKLLKLADGRFLIADVQSAQDTPLAIERLVKNTAAQDTYECSVGIEQDPGSAGVGDKDSMVRLLAGFDIRVCKPTNDKETRARPVSAQCEQGNVLVLRGHWNEDFFKEAENFPDGAHDDQIDALSGGFNELCGVGPSILDVL